MDSLSRLLEMARLNAVIDRHCLLSSSTVMDVAAEGPRRAAFHVLLEGSSSLRVGDIEIEMNAGDIVIVSSGAEHRFLTPGAASARAVTETSGPVLITTRTQGHGDPVLDLYCGHFEYGPGAGSILFRTLPTPLRASLADSPDQRALLVALSTLLRAESSNEGRGTAAVLNALCTVLLAYALRGGAGHDAESPLWTASADPDVARVLEAMLAAPGEAWSIATLARAARMSRATFLRRFSASTGMTPGQLLGRIRVMAAAELLTSDGLTIAAVAALVGFQSESSFSRAFRTEVGESPGRFRRANRIAGAGPRIRTVAGRPDPVDPGP